ncbi:MAG TPA: hypothetical protein PKH54_14075, partial [Myxococcota bacterium]|nr:hypothetical protein [Myxococcota bacterium]
MFRQPVPARIPVAIRRTAAGRIEPSVARRHPISLHLNRSALVPSLLIDRQPSTPTFQRTAAWTWPSVIRPGY